MRHLPAIVVAVVLGGVALGPAAAAQEADDELAGYVGMASGAVFSLQPIFPGLLPTGDAPFEVTGAFTAANVKSGGNAYGQAAAVWPGSAAANLGPLIGTGANQPVFNELIPPYPLAVDANQDDGEQVQGAAPGPVMRANGEAEAAEATTHATGADVPGMLRADSVSSTSRALVEGGQLVTESIVTLAGVTLGDGVVTIDALKSVARATSDGESGEATGSTVITGLAIAGQAAELTEDGLVSAGLPVEVLTTALEGAGITLELTKGAGGAEGGAADRVSAGLIVTIDNPAAAANPQFVGSKFVLSLAPTAVGALASPPFDFDFDDEFPVLGAEGDGGGGGGFSSVASTVSDTFSSVGESTADAPAPAPEGPLVFEPARRALEAVGGLSTGLLLGLAAAMFFGARGINRYVTRFVSTEES